VKTFIYFAYGSNMLSRRLRERTPSASVIGTGHVEGRRLAFHKVGKDGSAKCDIQAANAVTDKAYGVLFRVAYSEKGGLDSAEGLGEGYREESLLVRRDDGTQITARAYVATAIEPNLRPYDWYKGLVVAGAMENGLPRAYVERLRTVDAQPDPDANRRKQNEDLLFHSHHDERQGPAVQVPVAGGVAMRHEVIHWSWDGRDLSVGLSRAGSGATILLLPALSSISTRRELEPLQARLSHSFDTVAVDWPGFGDLPRPYVDWRPETYQAFLSHLLARVAVEPAGIVAAGHAAGYALHHFARHGGGAGRLVLLSPTWRGPLPTMAGGQRALFPQIAKAVDRPLLGPVLYRLNVNRLVVGMMARGHVYADPGWLNGPRMRAKLAVTRAPGARHGSARFVTGCLDPFSSRDEQLQAARQVRGPVLSVFSETAPTKSRLEMEALAALPSVSTLRVPRGKLSFYEEFPADAGEPIRAFVMGTLDVDGSSRRQSDSLNHAASGL